MKKTSIKRSCRVCSEEFSVHQYRINTNFFCSTKCSAQFFRSTKEYSQFAKERNLREGRRPPARPNRGISTKNELIRKSVEMKRWKIAVFTRDNYTCQGCGVVGGNLQADHELPFCMYEDLRLELLNGRTFCKNCHQKYGWKKDDFWHKLEADLIQQLKND